MFLAGENAGVEFVGDLGDGGEGEFGLVGDGPEEPEPEGFETHARGLADTVVFLGENLVEDNPEDGDALLGEQGAIEADLVDGTPHAAFADNDNGGAEHGGDVGVGGVEDGTDAGVTGALDDYGVDLDGQVLVGGHDLAVELVAVAAGDVALGEAAGDGNGTHVDEIGAGLEDVAHEDGVLVDLVAVDLHVALTDGLHEGGAQSVLAETVKESERDGGLAGMLPGGGDVNGPFSHRGIIGRRGEAGKSPVAVPMSRGHARLWVPRERRGPRAAHPRRDFPLTSFRMLL